jgi:anti-anti-sigma regulatory factor
MSIYPSPAATPTVASELQAQVHEWLRQAGLLVDTDLRAAINLASQAHERARADAAAALVADCLMVLTDLHEQDGNHEQAMDCALLAIGQIDFSRHDPWMARFLHALGRTYAVYGDYDRALGYLQQAFDLARDLPDPTTEGFVYLTLSMIYSRVDKLDEMRGAIAKALAMPEFERLPVRLRAYLLHDAASTAAEAGEDQLADQYIERALALLPSPWMLTTYSSFQRQRGDDAGARQTLERALASVPAHDDQTEAYVRLELARLLFGTGDPAEATSLLEGLLAMPKIEHAFRDGALELLIERSTAAGDYRQAFEYQRQRYQLAGDQFHRQLAVRERALDVETRSERARYEQQSLQERNHLLEQMLHERTQALEQQKLLASLIAELSTPVLPLVPGVLVLPVVGVVDSARMNRMLGAVLGRVAETRAHALILDITGVPLVDTHVAGALLNMARSVKLLGCQCVLVGIRPEIAQAIVGLGLGFGELTTRATLADGLAAAGVRIAV